MSKSTYCKESSFIHGFTLIELMITIAIVGILASIAYPSYTAYINRARIIEATSALSDYRIKMEQYYQDNRNYGVLNSNCSITAPTTDYFTISCTVGGTNQTYVATASSNTKMGSAGDYTYTIDDGNSKITTKFKAAVVNKNCWLVKGSEC